MSTRESRATDMGDSDSAAGGRLMHREEAIFVVTDLLGYRGPLRADVFHLADDTLEARLCVDPDIAFEALQRSAMTEHRTGGTEAHHDD